MSECKHEWQYQGVVHHSGHTLPGSGARERVYEDRYFCKNCLAIFDKNPRVQGNDYSEAIKGSFPK